MPDSPVISTVMLERASLPMARNTCCMAGRGPSSSGMRGGAGLDVPGTLGLLRGAPHEGDRLVDVEGLGQVLERSPLVSGRPRCRDPSARS